MNHIRPIDAALRLDSVMFDSRIDEWVLPAIRTFVYAVVLESLEDPDEFNRVCKELRVDR